MSKPFVAVLMGSDSDLGSMQACLDILNKLEVAAEAKITSAHRTPDITHAYIKDADKRGCAVFTATAGTAAGLTPKPVIGVPMEAGPLNGLDALLSTVMMPGGIPVTSVAIGKAGARNAGYLAAQILSLGDAALADRLRVEREENAREVQAKDADLQKKLAGT
jgi:5-(carboxyamino)imidazole ribonucleotide mutase